MSSISQKKYVEIHCWQPHSESFSLLSIQKTIFGWISNDLFFDIYCRKTKCPETFSSYSVYICFGLPNLAPSRRAQVFAARGIISLEESWGILGSHHRDDGWRNDGDEGEKKCVFFSFLISELRRSSDSHHAVGSRAWLGLRNNFHTSPAGSDMLRTSAPALHCYSAPRSYIRR